MTLSSVLFKSPIQPTHYSGFNFYIKRDDLLNPYFSGNKARKFAHYLNNAPTDTKTIVGYGSVQANSLLSLAALAKLKGWQLHYYVDRIPTWLKDASLGNYGQALSLGAKVIERSALPANSEYADKNLDTLMHHVAKQLPSNALFIPEGGRSQHAQLGVNELAKELAEHCELNQWFSKYKTINIMLPSGTGTTALFLQTWFCKQSLPIKVLTCACVGDSNYLQEQFNQLNSNQSQWPTILPNLKKYHFGKLYAEHFTRWNDLNKYTGIEFDLLYDPLGWESIINYLQRKKPTTPTIYIHQGGLVGNQSMLPRYKRKYPHLF
jgi:1-aminocyclopropane-1-carboxylate deaminase